MIAILREPEPVSGAWPDDVLAAVLTQAGLAGPGALSHQATGAGHFTQFTPAGEFYRTFSFTAREDSDGTGKGQAQVNSRAQGTVAHIGIDCLKVVNNVAVMSGIVTHSNNPAEVGTRHAWRATDNGEGQKDPSDLITVAPDVGLSFDCDTDAVPRADNPIEHGNIQVG